MSVPVVNGTIVGVAPRGFRGVHLDVVPDAWLFTPPANNEDATGGVTPIIARLRAGISLRQAQAEIDVLAGTFVPSTLASMTIGWSSSSSAHLPALGLQLVQLLPLYFLLNDDRSGRPQSDELAASYVEFDSRAGIIARDNLAVGVWRRVAEPFAAATGRPA